MARFPLTDEQQSIVAKDEGTYLVIAPPGSGKTTVLTERVARLIAAPGETFRILALTFTNKACANMRERLFEAVGEHSRRVDVRTIHSFCLDLLRSYGDRIGVPANPSIYDNDDDRVAALEQGLTDEGYPPPARRGSQLILNEIAALKRSLVAPSDAQGTIEQGVPLNVAYEAYDRTMKRFGALDFDDILLRTYELLTNEPRVAQHYRRMYRYIVMDEAQDTTKVQFEVVAALCGSAPANVMLVADADQSIFGFAGASPENLERFKKAFGAIQLELTQNFRSARAIVNAANNLISHSRNRVTASEQMSASTLAEGSLEAYSLADQHAEAEFVVARVREVLTSGLDQGAVYKGEATTVRPEDTCILARSRFALASVLAALDNAGVAYQFAAGGGGLFETKEFRAIEAALRVIENEDDRPARRTLLRCSGLNGRISDGAALPELFYALVDQAPADVKPIFEPLQPLASGRIALATAISQVVAASKATIPTEQEEILLRRTADADNLNQRFQRFAASTSLAEQTPSRFSTDLALVRRSVVEGPGCRVLTVHAAKGLEFRAVFLVGMNEGTFPDFRSVNSEEQVDEERRNAYVAITRAERLLLLTRPRERMTSAGVFSDPPSRFLTEMGVRVTDL